MVYGGEVGLVRFCLNFWIKGFYFGFVVGGGLFEGRRVLVGLGEVFGEFRGNGSDRILWKKHFRGDFWEKVTRLERVLGGGF